MSWRAEGPVPVPFTPVSEEVDREEAKPPTTVFMPRNGDISERTSFTRPTLTCQHPILPFQQPQHLTNGVQK